MTQNTVAQITSELNNANDHIEYLTNLTHEKEPVIAEKLKQIKEKSTSDVSF